MKKSAKFIWLLYAMIAIYGIILSWFIYVGPYLTYVVHKEIAATKSRIVVSLTTTPHRINKIRATLDAILQQSIKPDQIYLHVPYSFKRDKLQYVIPKWLQDYPGITLTRTEDYGPITKLLPTLQKEVDPNTIIITVDDDVWYPRHVVRDLVHYVLHNEKSAATPVHINFALDLKHKFKNIKYAYKHASKTALVIGAAGVAYKRAFFDTDFFLMLANLPKACNLSDDLIISMYLTSKQVNIHQVANASLHPWVIPFTYKQMPYRFGYDALSFKDGTFIGNEHNYCACITHLSATKYADLVQAWRNLL